MKNIYFSKPNKQTMKKVRIETPVVKPVKDCNCNKASLPCVMAGKCVQGGLVYERAGC